MKNIFVASGLKKNGKKEKNTTISKRSSVGNGRP